jgi:starch synthase
MYSLKYGTVPIVRETGGLADTIENFNAQSGEGNGFTFKKYDASEMLKAIKRAVKTFQDKTAWTAIQKAGMQKDYSWNQSAQKYLTLYEMALTK